MHRILSSENIQISNQTKLDRLRVPAFCCDRSFNVGFAPLHSILRGGWEHSQREREKKVICLITDESGSQIHPLD